MDVAQPGLLSAVPQPRPRTPSPVRAVCDGKSIPAPARDFDISPDTTDVIYAEDEDVFRETAVSELLKVGFLRQNIHEAENGLQALDHLANMQIQGHVTKPLLVLLDVRMPDMDGRECAFQIQQLVKQKQLRREPFVVCISSIAQQVEVDEGGGNFQVVLPKPISAHFIEEVFHHLRDWWTFGFGRQLPAWKSFCVEQIDLIVADEEPVCRMSAQMAFISVGVQQEAVAEVDCEEELLEQLAAQQAGDSNRPLILLLGKEEWASYVHQWVQEAKQARALRRVPFVICTSVDSERIGASSASELFHAFLPANFVQKDVSWSLEYCRLWWLTRSVGTEHDFAEQADFSDAGTAEELSDEECAD